MINSQAVAWDGVEPAEFFLLMKSADHLGGRFTFPGTSRSVFRMGLGTAQFAGAHAWGPVPKPEAAAEVVRAAVSKGIDHIHTCDGYGPHFANELVRDTVQPMPKSLVLSANVGVRRGADRAWLAALTPTEVRASVHDNLRHLGVEAIEVASLRMLGKAPTEGSLDRHLAALLELKREGRIRHIALSNVTPRQVRQARAVTDIVAVHNHYDLTRRQDDALIDALALQGIAYVPLAPLRSLDGVQLETLSEIAVELDVTPSQVALAWFLQRAPNILLVPSTSSVAHLEQNVAAASLVLPATCISKLDALGVA